MDVKEIKCFFNSGGKTQVYVFSTSGFFMCQNLGIITSQINTKMF